MRWFRESGSWKIIVFNHFKRNLQKKTTVQKNFKPKKLLINSLATYAKVNWSRPTADRNSRLIQTINQRFGFIYSDLSKEEIIGYVSFLFRIFGNTLNSDTSLIKGHFLPRVPRRLRRLTQWPQLRNICPPINSNFLRPLIGGLSE